MKTDQLKKQVTDSIIAMMESDGGNWQAGWARGAMPKNATTGKSYRGINVFILGAAGGSNEWASYKQWKAKGAQVRKGEKGTPIVFFKILEKVNADNVKKTFPLMRYSNVFNADQVDGYDTPLPADAGGETFSNDRVDAFVLNTGASIQHAGDQAFYNPNVDAITMPPMQAFNGTDNSSPAEVYYSTLFHELTHWTGSKSRLDRFGSTRDDYATEELVAEMGAAFLCMEMGVTAEPRVDHARYIKSWLKALKGDDNAIFKAAAKAGRAVEFLQSMQQETAKAA